jgi:F-type H+-transporting ATPase subunit b
MPYALTAILQEGHDATEGFASPFEVNFGLFFWTWVVFIVLFFVLKKFAWPPIVRLTEEREHTIKRQLDEAEQMNADAKATLEENKKLLASAKDDAQKLIAEAKGLAEQEREQLLAKTREEQERQLERTKAEIDAEREKAVNELRREAVDLSLAAAAKLIQQRLESESDRRIVEEYLGTLEERD